MFKRKSKLARIQQLILIMTKQEQIEAWNQRPIQVGDDVKIEIRYQTTKTIPVGRGKTRRLDTVVEDKCFTENGVVKKILNSAKDGRIFAVQMNHSSVPYYIELPKHHKELNLPDNVYLCREEWIKRLYNHCGNNPFKSEPPRVQFFNKTLDSIFLMCEYARSNNDFSQPTYKTIEKANSASEIELVGKTHGGCNFDPYVIDKNGQQQHFQRGLVWTLEQKQQLIESIYNWIEIGKIVFRYRSWEQLTEEMKRTGHGFHWECIDGKQRLNTILEFLQGKFADLSGNYWEDLSYIAQHRFLNYDRLAFAQLEEGTSDSDVIRVFLTLNYTGTPMSIDHIKFVQSINI